MNQYYRQTTYPYNRFECDERSPLLPFLAGVLVTTPFIFAAKNNNQQPIYYPPQQYPTYYPISQNPQNPIYMPQPSYQMPYYMPR